MQIFRSNKSCSKCGEAKPLSAFYRHPTGADGLMQTCKDCKRQTSANTRLKNKIERPEILAGYSAKYWEKYPIKRRAHTLVSNAIRDKRLSKGPCEKCGSVDKVHGHHDDYLRPFEVRWLCPIHHKEWHTIYGEAKNAL